MAAAVAATAAVQQTGGIIVHTSDVAVAYAVGAASASA